MNKKEKPARNLIAFRLTDEQLARLKERIANEEAPGTTVTSFLLKLITTEHNP